MGEKVNLNCKDGLGNTPLHYSAKGSHEKTLAYLLEHDADPNVQNNAGETPLHIAAGLDAIYIDIVKALLDNGADPNVTTRANKKPLNFVRSAEARSLLVKAAKTSVRTESGAIDMSM